MDLWDPYLDPETRCAEFARMQKRDGKERPVETGIALYMALIQQAKETTPTPPEPTC